MNKTMRFFRAISYQWLVLQKFKKKVPFYIILLFSSLFIPTIILPPLVTQAAEISFLDVRLNGDELIVSTTVRLDQQFIDEAKNGIQKELLFYIDLFRVWKTWPDEYVFGNLIEKRITGDVIKGEYILNSYDRNRKRIIEKKYKTFESMIKEMTELKGIQLLNIKGLEPGDYYVRVTVESRIRKLPPVIGYILFFVPEKEFSIFKDSNIFKIGPK